MLNRALQIGLGLLLLAGCRQQPPEVVVVNQDSPDKGKTTIVNQPPVVTQTPGKGKSGDKVTIKVDEPDAKSEPQESSVTDSSGRHLTGKMGSPPTEEELIVPVFKPSQITEIDAGAYRLETKQGTVLGMNFATERSQDEVRQFYEQTLTGHSWEASVGRLSGMYDGHRVEVIIQPGATSAFEIQVWL